MILRFFELLAVISFSILGGALWGIAAFPSIFLVNTFWSLIMAQSNILMILYLSVILGVALMIWIISFVILVAIIGFVFPLKLSKARVPYRSIPTTKWVIISFLHVLGMKFVEWFQPTVVMNIYFKALGANIEKGVRINTARIWDMSLITIGKGTVIGGRAVILGHLAEKGEMVFAPVKIGKKCLIGTSAQINPGCTIGDGAVIASRAVLKKYTHVPAGEIWGGIPAKKIKESD